MGRFGGMMVVQQFSFLYILLKRNGGGCEKYYGT